jgi:uncharacterized membrane protein
MFLILAFLFAVGSAIGWAIEVVYRRFFSAANKERKWINPGFLSGPYLPMYGFALIVLFLLAKIESYVPIENNVLRKLALFIIMAICITIIEYFTGLIFIVKMKIKLWDYSHNFGNIKGIICPLYSFFWMILSAIFYFLVNPYISNALKWLSENLAFSFVIGFFFGVFAIDLFESIRNIIKISSFALENDIIILLDDLKNQIRTYKEQKKEKAKFILSYHSSDSIQNHLKRYKEIRSNIKERLPKIK